jgi:transcriptional regulator with GAF, ATPase, and Fis domain
VRPAILTKVSSMCQVDPLGLSPALKQVLKQVEAVAPTGSTVLILGNSGRGTPLHYV